MYYWSVARQNPVLLESSSGPKPVEARLEHIMAAVAAGNWLFLHLDRIGRTGDDGVGSRVVLSQWSRDRSAVV